METHITAAHAHSLPSFNEMEQAFYHKDASYDGLFFVAVRTTKIFCRPSCAARPKRENIEFYPSIAAAETAGYRACKRCHPAEVYGAEPSWVAALTARLAAAPDAKLSSDDLRTVGVSPERARRWFRQHRGMTLTEWWRGQRLAAAHNELRGGASLDDVALAHGYESHSGFREAFGRVFGVPPGQSHSSDYVAAQIIETPLGAMIAAATAEGVCMLDYADRQTLEQSYALLQQRFDGPVLPTTHPHLEQLRSELGEYFAGTRTSFGVPVVPRGTAFQERVWQALQSIPHNTTIAYDELARRIGQPTAMRAVAQANGHNRINILIPCHRVIGKNGQLTGYGGGVWRKRLLLELEQTGTIQPENTPSQRS